MDSNPQHWCQNASLWLGVSALLVQCCHAASVKLSRQHWSSLIPIVRQAFKQSWGLGTRLALIRSS